MLLTVTIINNVRFHLNSHKFEVSKIPKYWG